MSKLILWLALANASYAACDFSTGVQEKPDGYLYSRDCHIAVGKLVKNYPLMEQRVVELEKTIELKDLALIKQDQRIELWRDTSFKMQDKLNTYDSLASTTRWVHFGLGVVVTMGAVWAAGQLAK